MFTSELSLTSKSPEQLFLFKYKHFIFKNKDIPVFKFLFGQKPNLIST